MPVLLFAAAVVFAELVAAQALMTPRLAPLLALGPLAIAAAVVWRWPMVGMTLLVVLVASIFPSKLILIPFGPLELRGHEIILAGMFGLAVVNPRRRTWGGLAGAAIVGFLAVLAFSSVAAIQAGHVDVSDAFINGRVFAFLLVFFIVIRLFPDRESLDLLMKICAIVAALTGVVSLMFVAHIGLPSLIETASKQFAVEQDGITGSLERVRLPGTALAYVLFLYVLLRVARSSGRDRIGWATILAGLVVNLALSFNRNMWVGLFLGVSLLMVIGGVRLRRFVTVSVMLIAVTAVVATFAGVGQGKNSPITPLVQRGTTLFRPSNVGQENSLQDRARENRQALKVIPEHLLYGIGVGTPFGIKVAVLQLPSYTYVIEDQVYLHNQYLYLLMTTGIPGLLLFVGFAAVVLRRGYEAHEDHEILTWTIAAGLVMLSAVVMLSLSSEDMLAGLALVAGAVIASTQRVDGELIGLRRSS